MEKIIEQLNKIAENLFDEEGNGYEGIGKYAEQILKIIKELKGLAE